MSTTFTIGGNFDLQIWNGRADAALLVEIQTLAIALHSGATPPARANHRVGTVAVMAAQQRRTTPIAPSPTGVMGPRLLRTLSFVIANTIIHDLLPVINTSPQERMKEFTIMVAKAVAAAAAAGLTAKALEALERGLLRNAGVILNFSTRRVMLMATIIPAHNAFKSLWYYVTSRLTSSPESAQECKDAAAAHWSCDSHVSGCATTVAAIVATTVAPYIVVSPVLLGALEAFIFYGLQSVVESVMEKKAECSGWWAMIRMWVLPEEPRAWSSDEFDEIEMNITDALRCPITHNLVVDPVVGPFLPNSRPHVYERASLYRHLKATGRDPLTNRPVTALDYKYSRVAARLSTEIAHRYGAVVRPLE